MSPPADRVPNADARGESDQPIYSNKDRALLLRTAHLAIEAAVAGTRDFRVPEAPTQLHEPRGAFTTLHLDGQLRGCVGYVVAEKPLIQTVAETAIAAAFHDPRFPSVTAAEAPRLKLEISVLSLPKPIRPDAIVPGVHGLIVSLGPRRGLLLPQVATEHDWDAQTFLAQTCVKAGLPPDAWQRGATVEAFTAEVFGEE